MHFIWIISFNPYKSLWYGCYHHSYFIDEKTGFEMSGNFPMMPLDSGRERTQIKNSLIHKSMSLTISLSVVNFLTSILQLWPGIAQCGRVLRYKLWQPTLVHLHRKSWFIYAGRGNLAKLTNSRLQEPCSSLGHPRESPWPHLCTYCPLQSRTPFLLS